MLFHELLIFAASLGMQFSENGVALPRDQSFTSGKPKKYLFTLADL